MRERNPTSEIPLPDGRGSYRSAPALSDLQKALDSTSCGTALQINGISLAYLRQLNSTLALEFTAAVVVLYFHSNE